MLIIDCGSFIWIMDVTRTKIKSECTKSKTNNLEMPYKILNISFGHSSSFSDIQGHTDVKKQLQTWEEMGDIIILKSQEGTRKSILNVFCSLLH